jgi:general secretion pathway protein J
MEKRFDYGFTLVEVMVSMTILGFIILMVYGVFRLGGAAWEKGDQIREKYQKNRSASQLISRQVKSAVPYKIKPQKAEGDYLAFEGTANSLRFVSALPLKTMQNEGLVYVFYEFQAGGIEGGRLILYEQRALNRNFIEERPKEELAVSLFEEMAEVKFAYYREENQDKNQMAGWVETWSAKEEKELPKAVQITMVSNKARDGRGEIPFSIFAPLPSNRFEELRPGAARVIAAPQPSPRPAP